MDLKIWRFFTQILCHHSSSIDILKPFFENLNNKNINDESILKTFSQYQLNVLYKNAIITQETLYAICPKAKSIQSSSNDFNENDNNLEETLYKIIEGDKVLELQKFTQENDINSFIFIINSFKEVNKMKIPLIQFCIMKKAINCFKYILINGIDDPNKLMEENDEFNIKHLYEWDCMATAIYFGNMNIVKILEEKGFEKGKKGHIEAAILSYHNSIAEQIIDEKIENQEFIQDLINEGLFAASKSNNIKGAELLIEKGCIINIMDKRMKSFKKTAHHSILQHNIIQKK